MTCCIEKAVQIKFQDLLCDQVKSDKIFINYADCDDCFPYVTVKAKTSTELVTSCGAKLRTIITVACFFASEKEAFDSRAVIETWLQETRGCKQIGSCGCLCTHEMTVSEVARAGSQGYRYLCSFRAAFSASSGTSSSS